MLILLLILLLPLKSETPIALSRPRRLHLFFFVKKNMLIRLLILLLPSTSETPIALSASSHFQVSYHRNFVPASTPRSFFMKCGSRAGPGPILGGSGARVSLVVLASFRRRMAGFRHPYRTFSPSEVGFFIFFIKIC